MWLRERKHGGPPVRRHHVQGPPGSLGQPVVHHDEHVAAYVRALFPFPFLHLPLPPGPGA